MADRIVVMRGGIVEQVGRPLDLYDHPVNTFVATFIGSPSMNLIEGKVRDDGFETADGVRLPLPAGADRTAQIYGIRPEHLTLAEIGVPATVSVVEPTGSETQIVARLGTATVTLIVKDRVDLTPGQHVYLRPELGKVHQFDQAGAALK